MYLVKSINTSNSIAHTQNSSYFSNISFGFKIRYLIFYYRCYFSCFYFHYAPFIAIFSLLIFDESDKSIIFDPTLTINPPIIFLSILKFIDNFSQRTDDFLQQALRNRPVELVGYRRRGIPYLQVLMVFTIDREDKRQKKTVRQYFDYWCDICSIPMYEIKRCECCQGPIRMRFQPRGLPSYIRTDAKPKAKPPASPNRDASP